MRQFRKRMLVTGLAVTVFASGGLSTINSYANEKLTSKIVFSDVSDDYFAKAQIEEFINAGIIEGYEDGTFRPKNNVTRAEFVKIVNKAFGFNQAGNKSFKDVKDDALYANDVKIAVEKGYIDGFEDNTFRPQEKITREQMAKILGTILNIKGDGQTDFLDDVSIATWAKPFVDALVDRGIINGYPDKTFKPKGNATRGEGVCVISNSKDVLENDTNNPEVPPVENPEQKPVENPTKEQIDNLFADTNTTQVTVTGNIPNVTVPTGKALVIEESATIDNNLVVEGEIKVNGNLTLNSDLSIDNGGSLVIGNIARTNSTNPTISGSGNIDLKDGFVDIKDENNLNVNINATNKSKLKIGQTVLLDTTNSTLTLTSDNSVLEFKLNPSDADFGKILVDGNLRVNENLENYTLKSKKEDSIVLITDKEVSEGVRNPIKANLEGVSSVEYGYYKGIAGGSFTKTKNTISVATSIEKTTDDTLLNGDVSLKNDVIVMPNLKIFGGANATKIDLVDLNGNDILDTLDIDEKEGFMIKVEIPYNKAITGIKINGKTITLPNVIEQRSYAYIKVLRDDLKNLGLDVYGQNLNIQAIETDVAYEGPTTNGIWYEGEAQGYYSPSSTAKDIIPQDTSVSDDINLHLKETTVEVLLNGKSVREIDAANLSKNDEVQIKVHLYKTDRLNQLVFANNYTNLSLIPQTAGKTITITYDGYSAKELFKDLSGNIIDLNITAYMNQ